MKLKAIGCKTMEELKEEIEELKKEIEELKDERDDLIDQEYINKIKFND